MNTGYKTQKTVVNWQKLNIPNVLTQLHAFFIMVLNICRIDKGRVPRVLHLYNGTNGIAKRYWYIVVRHRGNKRPKRKVLLKQ